jgi:NADP-dependent 3-hydroxy acid dehydrogenase YdfG
MSVMDKLRLDGRVVIVTGASSGLGVASATAVAEAGADVVLAARRTDKLAETAALVERCGKRAVAVETDVTDPVVRTKLAEALEGSRAAGRGLHRTGPYR